MAPPMLVAEQNLTDDESRTLTLINILGALGKLLCVNWLRFAGTG